MLFTNLNGFKWVQDDGTMLIFMVEMSTKKRKKAGHKKKTCPQSGCTNNIPDLHCNITMILY